MRPRNCRTVAFEVEVGLSIEEAFRFFSDIGQLNAVTPPWFQLDPVSEPPEELGVGSRIDYRFHWRRFGLQWRTHITDWSPFSFFAYEQERGPYRYFRHEHRFEPTPRGTLVGDIVHYSVTGGAPIGRWLVEPDLRRVFSHRSRVARQRFPLGTAQTQVPAAVVDLPA